MSMKVCNTEDLTVLARRADRAGVNRRVTESFRDRLDPEGTHTLAMLVPFMGDGGWHRCRVLAKMVGTNEPGVAHLDVPSDLWERLLDATEIMQS